ncbi:MAG TPA: glycosyltransferase [Acidimicrobiales bacterium]|nr:glycosyltransferase [Acidimicrobiales bacterium]
MSVAPEICVVVPTHDKADRLPALIDALAAQSLAGDRFEVVVVDDCSTDGTAAVLADLIGPATPNMRSIRTAVNSGGPSIPRNTGWRSSKADVVVFLDDDCLPEPSWLEAALEAMQANPSWGVCQGCTVLPPGIDPDALGRWDVERQVLGMSPWFEGTNIFYRRRALEEVDGFDETIPWWGEDTDLGWRVVEAGWGRGFAPKAVAVHEVADRGWRWAAKFGWLDQRVIQVAARHPQLRQEGFWRPWALHRPGAEFAAALAGLALATRWKPAAAAALPYLVCRRPPFRRDGVNRQTIALGFQTVAVDMVRLAGHLRGSVSARMFVV